MIDNTQHQVVGASPVIYNDQASALPSQTTLQFQRRIAELLMQVDREAEQFRDKITGLVAQVATLSETAKGNDASEYLVLQLREANQNLIIAALGAQDMQAKAENVSRRQEEFLSMLAHELRNPLAPIVMTAELLGKITDAHPQLPKLQAIILRQAKHMTHLVDDLLDASRVSSGKISLKPRVVLLSEIIESAVETSQPFIEKRHQQLNIVLPSQHIAIEGDLVRLAQVFSNLLINATKFTPEYERIAISAHTTANSVTISVKDNGMGIDPAIQPFIFDLFTQGFRSLDRSQGGLGIGLSLARTIIEMHAGTISVHSAGIGFGSEFLVSLPISAKPFLVDLGAPPRTSATNYCRILLIEDNIDANETLNDMLALEGHTITSAFDGTTGLALAKENTYDVIICDIGLPGIDGYEVIKQLRQQAVKPAPCFIALSGYNEIKHPVQARESGFDHYLVKPVASDILMNLIASCSPR